MDKQSILDDHLFNADFSNLNENYLRTKTTIEYVTKLWEGENIQ